MSYQRRPGATQPEDHNLLAWTFDPAPVGSSSSGTAGTIQVAKLVAPTRLTISNLWLYCITAGTGLTAGACFGALYDGSKALLAQTTDQATAWASTGAKSMALASSQSVAAGAFYVAWWSNGTTQPAFLRGGAAALVNIGLATASSRYATADTATTTTAPATLGTFTALGVGYWVGVS